MRVCDTSVLKGVHSGAAGVDLGSSPQVWQECGFFGFSTVKSSFDVKRVRLRWRERHFSPPGRLCLVVCPSPGGFADLQGTE